MSDMLCTEISTDFHSIITIKGDLLNLLNVSIGDLLYESLKCEDSEIAEKIKYLQELDKKLFTIKHVGGHAK